MLMFCLLCIDRADNRLAGEKTDVSLESGQNNVPYIGNNDFIGFRTKAEAGQAGRGGAPCTSEEGRRGRTTCFRTYCSCCRENIMMRCLVFFFVCCPCLFALVAVRTSRLVFTPPTLPPSLLANR